MCGIAGLTALKSIAVNENLVQSLLHPMEHRGPDDYGWCALTPEGILSGRRCAGYTPARTLMVHRRLSILDLSEAGRQPMGTSDGSHFLVLNGEIYNYIELRQELEALGYSFRSRSDTEVLLYGCIEWGPQVLRRLVGMFAFALLDARKRKLFLARDFFGIKPLYYARWQEGFAFSSEIKGLLQLPGVSRKVDPERLFEYLRFSITDYGHRTLYGQIRQLPAAHYMELSLDDPCEPQPVCYWKLDPRRRADISFSEAARHLRSLFLRSIDLHLRSDVPVGTALSGGIDSSSIVMAMRLLRPEQTIHSFSYIADDPAVNEERWVDIIAAEGRTRVHKIASDPLHLVSDMEHLIGIQEEPFASTSIYSQYRVFSAARRAGIKVMLDGQGADELLGGYEMFTAARLASLIRRGCWKQALQFWRKASRLPRKYNLLLWLPRFVFPSVLQEFFRHLIHREVWPAWLDRKWFIERGVHSSQSDGDSRLPDLMRWQLHTSLVHTSLPMLLRYEDRNSMAFSIESRVPFLTPEIAEFIFSLPEEYVIDGNGGTKAVFRRAMRGIVPDDILDRKDKIGFETPEKSWLCGTLRPWVEERLQTESLMAVPALNARVIVEDWQAVLNGRRQFDNRVWRWINVLGWTRQFGVDFD